LLKFYTQNGWVHISEEKFPPCPRPNEKVYMVLPGGMGTTFTYNSEWIITEEIKL
jgi:hypothetical protein